MRASLNAASLRTASSTAPSSTALMRARAFVHAIVRLRIADENSASLCDK